MFFENLKKNLNYKVVQNPWFFNEFLTKFQIFKIYLIPSFLRFSKNQDFLTTLIDTSIYFEYNA